MNVKLSLEKTRMTGSLAYTQSLFPIEAVEFNAGEIRQYEHISVGEPENPFVYASPDMAR